MIVLSDQRQLVIKKIISGKIRGSFEKFGPSTIDTETGGQTEGEWKKQFVSEMSLFCLKSKLICASLRCNGVNLTVKQMRLVEMDL